MIGFDEARIYGKWLFGKKFKYATETDDGWVFFMDKNDESLGEERTWDEFELTWKLMNETDSKFKAFVKKELESREKQ